MRIQIVIPARDEAAHIEPLLRMLRPLTDLPLIVVDNASTDRTGEIAAAGGAVVVREETVGKGYAAIAGLKHAISERVFFCDADISGLERLHLQRILVVAGADEAPLVRLALGRRPETAPVTTLTAVPLLAAVGVDGLSEPLGGLFLADREFVLDQHLPGGWGFDVALTLAGIEAAGSVPEISVSGVTHRHKPLVEYGSMAREVAFAILAARGLIPWSHRDCVLCSQTALRAVGDIASSPPASGDSGPRSI
jgi:glucosyl-3-phosphoglycerate synthase